MRSSWSRFVLLISLSAMGCAAGNTTTPKASTNTARIVVVAVYDQFGAAQFQRYLPYLHEDGAIKRSMRKGSLFSHARYEYAATLTAPGHTTLHCGATPSVCGVVANYVWDYQTKKSRASMDDGKHAVLGRSGKFSSPEKIRVPTVADQLKVATGGAAKVVSISLKDRAAMPGAGRTPDAVFWLDGRAGGFTTSSFFEQSLPPWAAAWRAEHPYQAELEEWVPATDTAAMTQELGPDAQSGEGNCFGLDAAFPHVTAEDSGYVFKMTPRSTRYLLAFAEEAVRQFKLGQDDVPDLLSVSISATDYAGHFFGPDSWEYMDTLIQSDLALGRFLARLEAQTTVAVVISSDHGVGRMPERLGKGGRIDAPELAAYLQAQLGAVLGKGAWVAGVATPYVYLTEEARRQGSRVIDAAVKILDARPDVYGAYGVAATIGKVGDKDPVVRAVAKSLYSGEGGDIYLVPAPFFVVNEIPPPDAGTSHGSPWDYDSLVPVVVAGPGVRHQRVDDEVRVTQVAPTVSALLTISPPAQARDQALPVFQCRRGEAADGLL